MSCDFTINYETLWDLRIDFAFKITFTKPENKAALISLLNAIFAHKGIMRVIIDLQVENPSLEREHPQDKLSILDILATLSDGSVVLIEMHLYGPHEFKYKVIRNWGRIYGGNLQAGEDFSENHPVICISFINFPITDCRQVPLERTHTLFQVMERDNHETLLEDMEVHFINMAQFVKEQAGQLHTPDLFSKWLSVITHAELRNKTLLAQLCKEEAEIRMAMEALSRFSAEENVRLDYERRKNEVWLYQMIVEKHRQAEKRAAEAEQLMAQERQNAAQEKQRADEAEQRIVGAVHRLQANQYTTAQIAEILQISEEAVNRFLDSAVQ